jgi:hypothetical protein
MMPTDNMTSLDMTSNDTRNSSEDIHRNAFHRHVELPRRLLWPGCDVRGWINRMGPTSAFFSRSPAQQLMVNDDSDGPLFDRA